MKDSYNKYYIYHLIDPKDSLPFYVGKGKNDRMYSHENESKRGIIPNKNLYLYNSIKQVLNEGSKIIYKKILENLTEQEAFLLESSEIKKYGRKNNGTGILTNMTVGGEGFSGSKHTNQTKIKISNRLKGKPTWASLHKKEMSVMFSGKGNPFYGQKQSKESIYKLSKSIKEKYIGKIHPLKGKTKSEIHRKKISEIQKGKKLSNETKKKMSISQQKRYEISMELKNKIIELYNMGYGCKRILKQMKKDFLFDKSIATVKSILIRNGYDLNKRNTIPTKIKLILENKNEIIFNSIGSAGKYLKCGDANLSKYLKGKRKTNRFFIEFDKINNFYIIKEILNLLSPSNSSNHLSVDIE